MIYISSSNTLLSLPLLEDLPTVFRNPNPRQSLWDKIEARYWLPYTKRSASRERGKAVLDLFRLPERVRLYLCPP